MKISKQISKWSVPKKVKFSSAVALDYCRETNAVPQIAVKGANQQVVEMKLIARRYGVPIHRSTQLTAKLKVLEVSANIPRELYGEVSKVIVSIDANTGTKRS